MNNIRSATTTTASRPINISSSPNDDDYQHHLNFESSDGLREEVYTTHLNDMNSDNDLHAKFNHLTVGSLPSIRRERRLLVSGGHHEFMNGTSTTGNPTQPQIPSRGRRRHSGTNFGKIVASNNERIRTHSDSSLIHQMSIASSMPVPSAPFLNSRNDPASGERLLRYDFNSLQKVFFCLYYIF